MTANTYGRQVVVPLTNKSGGGVIAGDVVIVDTGNNDAFTTTTSAAVTNIVGVVQETIANNAVGRVLLSGYAALVNVNASVTRGNYGTTHTVAKQATDGGASRINGTFCKFLTGGTTPDAIVFNPDVSAAGNVATDAIWDAKGDLAGGTGANTAVRLAVGTNGQVLTAASGETTGMKWSGAVGYIGYIVLKESQAANTQGGTFTSGAWQTRTLNTEELDSNSDCTLSSNQFTLAAGTYDIEASAPAWFVGVHKTRLYNTTDTATVLVGTSEYAPPNASDAAQTRSHVIGRFTIAASKALELQHRCSNTRATTGFGNVTNVSESEVYSVVRLWRVS